MSEAELPNGLEEIIARYGNPFALGGSPAEWESRHIGLSSVPPGLLLWLGRPLSAVRLNGRAQQHFRRVFIEMARAKLQGITFSRAYEWGVVDEQLSIHTWGIAIDMAHADSDIDLKVATIMVGSGGFVRSGSHYQLATGYEIE